MRPSPDGAPCGPFSHDGEEAGVYAIGTGSSFYFKSDHAYSYRAASAETCRIVWVNTPPTF